MSGRIDLDSTSSKQQGLRGLFETALRRFKVALHILILAPVYLIASVLLGFCLTPGITLFRAINVLTSDWSPLLQNFALGVSLAAGYFMYAFTMIFAVPAANFLIRGNLQEWRGPYYSTETVKWYLHNGLTYLARFTFLEFVTPTPLSLLFYQMMGMKLGKGVALNTTWISDPSLISIGAKTTIGGSVTIVAHYGQGGLLIISPVEIGQNCTVGLKATIMGGAKIGDGAKILPHSVVMPKTVIGPGETWGGVPAQLIRAAKAPDQVRPAA